MVEFDCLIAERKEPALKKLRKYGADAKVIAGGTDLSILLGQGLLAPRMLISIGKVSELRYIRQIGSTVSIGAIVTHSELARHPVTAGIGCLVKAASSIGSPQIRNAGTIGGNIANASPAADLGPPLLVLDASVHVESLRGVRTLKLENFLVGAGATRLEPDEIITEFSFGLPDVDFYSSYIKVGLRNALAISVASAAIFATSHGNKLDSVRIACGAVARLPIRMREVEKLVEGEDPSRELFDEIRNVASSSCDPISDIRATRKYRRHVTGVIVSRLVEDAFRQLTGYQAAER